MNRVQRLAIATVVVAMCTGCGASPGGAPTATAGAASAATGGASSPGETSAATGTAVSSATPAGPQATTKVSGSFVINTTPNVRHATGGIVCLIASDESFARYEMPDVMGGPDPFFILIVGQSSQTPEGLPARGGGIFTGPSVLLDGKTVVPDLSSPSVNLSPDLQHAVLTGRDGNVTYEMTMDCEKT